MFLVLTAVFLGMAWFSVERFPPWISWHNEIWAFGAVIALAAHLLFGREWRSAPVKVPFAAWPLALLASVAIVQGATGQIAFAGEVAAIVLYLIVSLMAMSAGFVYGASPPTAQHGDARRLLISRFAILVLLGGLISVVVATVQPLELWEQAGWIHRMPGPRRPGANLGQTNHLATLLLFSVASLVYLCEAGKLKAFTAVLLMVVLLFGLAITESRTGALSLLVMFVWWIAKRKALGFRMSLAGAVFGIVVFAIAFWSWPGWLNAILLNTSTGKLVNLQAGTRLDVWPQLWEAVLTKPWTGWGLGDVTEALNSVLHKYEAGENFTYAHNVLLDLAIGMGLPLTLLIAASAFVWLGRRMRQTEDPVSWYCIALILPFGVHSLLEFPFAYAYLLVPVMFMIGVLEANLSASAALVVARVPATIAWAMASLIMVWSVKEYVAIEEDFRVARFEVMNMGQTKFEYERPRPILLTQMGALLQSARLVPQPGMTADQLELSQNVAMRFPSPAAHNRYAVALALNGSVDESLRQLKVMRVLYGEKGYAAIKDRWNRLAQEKYPQLGAIKLP